MRVVSPVNLSRIPLSLPNLANRPFRTSRHPRRWPDACRLEYGQSFRGLAISPGGRSQISAVLHSVSPAKPQNAGSGPPARLSWIAALKRMGRLGGLSERLGGAGGAWEDRRRLTSDCHSGTVAGAHSSGCPAHPPACLALPPGPCAGTAPGSTPCAQSSFRGSP